MPTELTQPSTNGTQHTKIKCLGMLAKYSATGTWVLPASNTPCAGSVGTASSTIMSWRVYRADNTFGGSRFEGLPAGSEITVETDNKYWSKPFLIFFDF